MPIRQFLRKFHRCLFILLIFFLPVQLGRHFWPSWSYVLGLRVDYLSLTLYLTDLLVVAILGLWAIEKELRAEDQKPRLKSPLFLFATLAFLLVNCFLAQNTGVALYKLGKIVELALLGFYVAENRYALYVIRDTLPWAVIYSSFIALAQFSKQASLGGLLWWLGERTFTSATPAIAKAVIDGRLLLRPYATFPHPNVLAGFILVALVLINMKCQGPRVKKPWQWFSLILGGMVIVISFSRTAWVVGLAITTWLVTQRLKRGRKRWFFVLGCLFLLTVIYFGWRFSTQEALGQRIQLTKVAGLMFQTAPLVGVGLNNFVVRLPEFWVQQTIYWLQPVHNVFLLVAAETGLIGLLVVLWLLYLTMAKLYREKNGLVFYSLLVIILLGVVDHYWLTLQQSQLLLTIVFGLGWREKRTVLQLPQ